MNARTACRRAALTLVLLGTCSQSGWGVIASQTITFDAIPNQILGVTPFPIYAHASSNLPVTLTPTLPAVCTTVGELVSLKSVGTCTITATQAGNGSFSAATPVTRVFTVSQGKAAGSFMPAPGSPF